MLWQRLLFGALLIAGLAGLLVADHRFFSGDHLALPKGEGLIVVAVVALLVLAGAGEMARLLRAAGSNVSTGWAAFASVFIVLVPFIAHNEIGLGGVPEVTLTNELTIVALVVGLLGAAFFVGLRRMTAGAAAAIAGTLFIVLYLGLLGQMVVRLRMFSPDRPVLVVVYFVATVKICDIGAYFTGYAIGRHKLIPWLSPKKTIEGFLGGVAASILLAWALERWLGIFAAKPIFGMAPRQAWVLPVIFGATMAIIGQAGDLLESLLKRDAQAKDSAHVIPAFGGVLDILDSILLTAPFACVLLVE